MTPEERLRAAFADRTARARVSPDALDGVFARVARHRRAVRAGVVGGVAASVLLAAVAAAMLRGGPDATSPVDPVPTIRPTASVTPTASPAQPRDRAVVAFADRRLVEVSTTTGDEIRTITTLPRAPDSPRMSWNRAKDGVYYSDRCEVVYFETRVDKPFAVGPGKDPAVSPDGERVAAVPCDDKSGVVVYGPRWHWQAYPRPTRHPDTGDLKYHELAATTSVSWYDKSKVLVTRSYESEEMALLLDVDTGTSLDDAEATRDLFLGKTVSHNGGFYAMSECCMPEWDKPDTLLRAGWRYETVVLTRTAPVLDVAVDDAGTFLFLDAQGLWRIDGKTPRLVVPGAIAVGA